jgi:hypothetical protein
VGQLMDLKELVEQWTVLHDAKGLAAGKRGVTRLGFKPDDLSSPSWSNRTARLHQVQVRRYLGFREYSVDNAEKLMVWLAAQVREGERRHDRIWVELVVRCWAERVESGTPKRVNRITCSALRTAEQTLTARIVGRFPVETVTRLQALVAARSGAVPVDDGSGLYAEADVFSLVRSVPPSMSLESMLVEIRKLRAVRVAGLFADVAQKVVTGWRIRTAVESPSRLHDPTEPLAPGEALAVTDR